MNELRVLLIAPDNSGDPLETTPEMRAIARVFRTELVTGIVSAVDIYRATEDREFDVIHIASHGDEKGISLSNGERFEAEALAVLAREVRAKVVYFNSCWSAQLGQFLINSGVPVTIVTGAEIPDRDAWTMAGYFYTELARNNGDFRAAYDIVKPQNGLLIWLSNGHYVEHVIEPLSRQIEAIQKVVTRVESNQANIELLFQYGQRVNRALMGMGGAGAVLYMLMLLHLLHVL